METHQISYLHEEEKQGFTFAAANQIFSFDQLNWFKVNFKTLYLMYE